MALFPIAKPKAHSLTGRITRPLLLAAFKTVKGNRGAAGIDKVSVKMFEANLAENLSALERALKSGSYEPLPLRRHFLDKGGGKFRPLGIPAVRDRVAQEVVRRLLTPIFEPLFHEASLGFRPGRNCHQALGLAMQYHDEGYRVILDADIVGFFDTLKHACWGGCLDLRVRDGVLRRLIGKYATEPPKADGPNAGTFDFLGFTHYWGKSREGRWVIRRKTSRKRLGRSLKRVSQWCRLNLHKPWRVQVEALGRKLKGHFGYFGITGNSTALPRYRQEVIRVWRRWLARRGDPKGMPWDRMNRLLAFFYLPEARVVHSIYAAKP